MAEEKKGDIYTGIISKAMKDESFRKRLKETPLEAIKEHFGLEIPADIHINVVEDSDSIKHLVIPSVPENDVRELTDVEVEAIPAGGLAPYTGQPTLMCDTAWQTCWVCGPPK